MKNRGFTLVEMMIVVAILGILAAVAVPMYRGYIASSKRQEAKSNLETIRLLEEQVFADRRAYLAGANTAALMDSATGLPGFQPGNEASLYYSYKVDATATTFTATATSKANAAEVFTINEKNEKSW